MTKEEEYLKLIKSKSEKEFRRECLNSFEPLPKAEPSRTCYPNEGESCNLCEYVSCINYQKSLLPFSRINPIT